VRAPREDRLFRPEEIEDALRNFEDRARPIGRGLRAFNAVELDIDEPIAISKGGAWDSAANKRFLISPTNRWTKAALTEVAPRQPAVKISLRAADARGEAAFREAAVRMLTARFVEVDELAAVTRTARQSIRNLNRSPAALRKALNGSIRSRIARGSDPEARLVNRALRAAGVDPDSLSTAPR
jgi:hypothetical protein